MLLCFEMERRLGLKMPFSTWIYLLHEFSSVRLDKAGQLLLTNLCVSTSLLLATYWKSEMVPSREEWSGNIRSLSLTSKLSALFRYRQGNSSGLSMLKIYGHDFFQFCSKTKWVLVEITSLLELL